MISKSLERKVIYLPNGGGDIVQIEGEYFCGDGKVYHDKSGLMYHQYGRVVRQNLTEDHVLDLVDVPLIDETSIQKLTHDCWFLNHVKTYDSGAILTISAVLRHLPFQLKNNLVSVSIKDQNFETTTDPILIPVTGRIIENDTSKNRVIVFDHTASRPYPVKVVTLSAVITGEYIPRDYLIDANNKLSFIVIEPH